MTTIEAAERLGEACTVLVDAGQMDYMAGAQAVMSTPGCTPERDAALDAFKPTGGNTPQLSDPVL